MNIDEDLVPESRQMRTKKEGAIMKKYFMLPVVCFYQELACLGI
jgi:hypothetical protein